LGAILPVIFAGEQACSKVEMEGVAHTFLAILLSVGVLFGDYTFSQVVKLRVKVVVHVVVVTSGS
jgi:hypothetical protein